MISNQPSYGRLRPFYAGACTRRFFHFTRTFFGHRFRLFGDISGRLFQDI